MNNLNTASDGPVYSKLGTALDFLTHGNIGVLAELVVGADVLVDERDHDGRKIIDARDTRQMMVTGNLEAQRLRIVEDMLLERIFYTGYGSLKKLMDGINDAGIVVPRPPIPYVPGKTASEILTPTLVMASQPTPKAKKAKGKVKAKPQGKAKKAIKAKAAKAKAKKGKKKR